MINLEFCNLVVSVSSFTIPETNSEFTPENGGLLEKEIPNLETIIFRCYVSFNMGVFP